MMQLVTREGDRWWKRAVDAGCTVDVPFAMQFWGDRWGSSAIRSASAGRCLSRDQDVNIFPRPQGRRKRE